eukprot:762692-Hanusia_phi.AAC.4
MSAKALSPSLLAASITGYHRQVGREYHDREEQRSGGRRMEIMQMMERRRGGRGGGEGLCGVNRQARGRVDQEEKPASLMGFDRSCFAEAPPPRSSSSLLARHSSFRSPGVELGE